MSFVDRAARVLRAAVLRARAWTAPPTPSISVIVPAFNVAEYVGQTIDSVLGQRFDDFEIIVVDDGSTDATRRIARRKAFGDARVRLYSRPNGGPGPAREFGIAKARGTYLSFLDADDLLPPDALEAMINSATRTGADIVVGAFRRFDGTRVWVPEWNAELHREPVVRTTLAQTPKLLRNNYPCGKLIRREFWVAQDLQFLRGVIYEDQPLIAQMFARAPAIDVLTTVTYDYRARPDRSSISQRPEEAKDLRDRVAAWLRSLTALQHEAVSESVLRAWYWTLYSTHFHWYLNNDAIAGEAYWAVLRSALAALEPSEPPGARDEVTAEKRLALQLLRGDRHPELLQLRRRGVFDQPGNSFVRADERGLIYDFGVEVPLAERTSAWSAVRIDHLIEHGALRSTSAGAVLELRGYARPRGVPESSACRVRIGSVGVGAPRTLFDAESTGGQYSIELPLAQLPLGRHSFEAAVALDGHELAVGLGNPAEWLPRDGLELEEGRHYSLRRHPNRHVPIELEINELRL